MERHRESLRLYCEAMPRGWTYVWTLVRIETTAHVYIMVLEASNGEAEAVVAALRLQATDGYRSTTPMRRWGPGTPAAALDSLPRPSGAALAANADTPIAAAGWNSGDLCPGYTEEKPRGSGWEDGWPVEAYPSAYPEADHSQPSAFAPCAGGGAAVGTPSFNGKGAADVFVHLAVPWYCGGKIAAPPRKFCEHFELTGDCCA